MNLNHKNARLRAGQGEDSFIGLVGDIGGTNARFAIAYRRGHEARLEHNQTIECAGFSDFYQAVDVYLAGLPERPSLDFVALAMAGPVKNGAINLTNLPWTVTEAELKAKTGAKVARLMNDYAGLAFSLPHLTIDDTRLIGSLQEVWAKSMRSWARAQVLAQRSWSAGPLVPIVYLQKAVTPPMLPWMILARASIIASENALAAFLLKTSCRDLGY